MVSIRWWQGTGRAGGLLRANNDRYFCPRRFGAVCLADVEFDFGDADGRRTFASPAVIGRFRHPVADRAEGDDEPAIAMVIHKRGNVVKRYGGQSVIHRSGS